MPRSGVIIGQNISSELQARARELRRNMTPAEKRLWEALRANRLDGFHFRRQQIIHGSIVDFYCHAAGLVIEVDGPVHQSQAEYDAAREAHLLSLGLSILRVTNEAVENDLEAILERIRAALKTQPPILPSLQGRGAQGG